MEHLSTGALLGEPGGGRGSFAGGPEGYERKALETDISLHGGSVGQPLVGSSTGDFERWLKVVLEVRRLSLWELGEGNLEGGLPCCGPWRLSRKGSWRRASISIGAPLGNLEWGSANGGFERWVKGMERLSL
jgi:hypothetical protein